MSKYGVKYQISFKNCEQNSSGVDVGQTIDIGIFDRSVVIDDSDTVAVVELEPAGDPLHISSIDNSEEKFTPIRAIQAVIKFHSDVNNNLSTFTDAVLGSTNPGDPRWYVEIKCNSLYIFKGFLELADCSEAFMPYPNVVTLTANDGLGRLKDIPFELIVTNDPPYYRIADYICGALIKTGLNLNLNAVFNIREENHASSHFFDSVWLWDKTFEGDPIGTYENCYSVLEAILGDEAFLTQRNGEWWILRVDELEAGHGLATAVFGYTGELSEIKADTAYDYSIGKDGYSTFFSQESTEVIAQPEHKYVKETFAFEYPKEIPCNVDFSRGDLLSTISDTQKHFTLDCWTLYEDVPNTTATHDTAYIRRIYNSNGYETERFAVIGIASVLNGFYLVSEFIPVHAGDKFDFSVDVKHDGQIETGSGDYTHNKAQIRLYADDATYYTLDGGTSSNPAKFWQSCDSAFTTNQKHFVREFSGNDDDTDWHTVTFADGGSAPVIPKDGYLKIVLEHEVKQTTFESHFSNLVFSYIPLINGSYQKYNNIYSKASRSIDFRAKRENTVKMSDGIKKLFKGSLFQYNGSAYVLADRFFNWIVIPSPTDAEKHSYLHLQTFDVWNQFRNVMKIFHATCQGLNSNNVDAFSKCNHPSLIHRYILQDTTNHTINRYFMLLTFDIDWFLCEWRGTLAEVYNSDKGKYYEDTDTLEVRYS